MTNAKLDSNRVPTLLAISTTDNVSLDNVKANAANNSLKVLDSGSVIGGTSISPLTVKGGVVRVIDSATGDIARTTSGWIEDEKYGWYAERVATAVSAEFDTAVTRTGAKTLKLSTTDATGRIWGAIRPNSSAAFATVPQIYKYLIPVKGSTSYRFTCYAKTTNAATNSCIATLTDYTATVHGTSRDTNALTGTNDFTALTKTFTTDASAIFLDVQVKLNVAGNISDAWFDINSMTLEEVTSITNSSSSPALFYPTATAVTSTDNIDQSVTSVTGTLQLGNAGSEQKTGQIFTASKKNLTGVIFQRGANTGSYVGDVTVSIQQTTSSLPNGTTVGTPVVIPNATWNAITVATDYTVSISATLTPGTVYAVVLSSSTTDNTNRASLVGNVSSSGMVRYNGSVWSANGTNALYFKSLYSKNTTNLTVSTATQTITYTAPTTAGWADGTVIDTATISSVTPLTLAPGANTIYVSSNGPSTADSTVDPSLRLTLGGSYKSVSAETAARDENRKTGIMAVSSVDGVSPVELYCDANGQLLIQTT